MHSGLLGLTDCIISSQQIGQKEDTRFARKTDLLRDLVR